MDLNVEQVYIIGFMSTASSKLKIRAITSGDQRFVKFCSRPFNTIKAGCKNRIYLALEFRGVLSRQGVISSHNDNVGQYLTIARSLPLEYSYLSVILSIPRVT